MTEDEMKRNFKMSKADLCMFASILANTLTRDIADLTPFGVTTAKIAELKTLGDAYEVFPSDDYLVGTMMIATDEKNAKMEEVKEAIRQLAARVEAKWGIDSGQYKRLGIADMSHFTDRTLLSAARGVHLAMTSYLSDLTDFGLTQVVLDDFNDLCDSFETAIATQKDAIMQRDIKTKERTEMGNQLHSLVSTYCNFGKILYERTDPARYNDYIMYPVTGAALQSPANFRYDFIGKTFWWDVVNHATSYQLEKKEGESYTEIYSGSETSFHYVPSDGQGFYRVRARNMNGFGPATEDLEQWYYAVLPPASNLVINDTEMNPGQYRLTWDAVPTATEYSVYRSVVENGQPAGDYSLQGKTADTSFVISVESGKRNYFRVNTKNLSQYAVPSEPVWIEV